MRPEPGLDSESPPGNLIQTIVALNKKSHLSKSHLSTLPQQLPTLNHHSAPCHGASLRALSFDAFAPKSRQNTTSFCRYWQDVNTVDGQNPANQLRLVLHPIIYKVLYVPGGAGFLPSTVPVHVYQHIL